MDPTKLTYDLCRDIWWRCHWPWEPPGTLSFLALRGATIAPGGKIVRNFDEPNLWNDTIVALDPNLGIRAHWTATAGQPGDYWTKRYEPGNGAPHPRPCCVRLQRGSHFEKQAMRLWGDDRWPVIRDLDKDRYAEIDELFNYATDLGNGINLHAGGNTQTVEKFSSGCHVLRGGWNSADWKELHGLVYSSYAEQKLFRYGLVQVDWLGGVTQRLLFGSVGETVTPLHDLLGITGEDRTWRKFGVATDRAYRARQKAAGERPDGICVNPPWLVAA